MKRYIKYYSAACVCLSLSACSDYLDVVPKNDIETIETIFEQKDNADEWLQTCYAMTEKHLGGWTSQPGFMGADELVCGELLRHNAYANSLTAGYLCGPYIGDGLQMAQEPYGNIWKNDEFYTSIRYCNIFIEKIGGTYNMEDSEKALWTAEIKALKAHLYFELLRRYGPFILVPENIDASADIMDMRIPRSSVDDCVNAIVELCDEVIPVLPYKRQKETSRTCYYNKEAAATLKAIALLYAASPLFNGNPQMSDFKNRVGEQLFPDYDKEKWHKAAVAADEALQICEEAGKKLINDNTSRSSEMLNTILNIEYSAIAPNYDSDECILMFNHQENGGTAEYWARPFFEKKWDNYYDSQAKNNVSPTIKMVEMFYTEHGVPIDEDKQWMASKYEMTKEADERYRNVVPLNSNVLSLHRRREPRFYADIAADRTIWYHKQYYKGSTREEALEVKAYKGELFGTQLTRLDDNSPQNQSGYWLKKFIHPDVAFRGYNATISSMFMPDVIFRLPDLLLASAEAWNEYLDTPDERVYNPLDRVRVRAGIAPVREAWAAYARNPEKATTKAGMRDIIRQEWNIEFAFEGRRFYNLRRWMTAYEELNQPLYGWNILGTDARSFYNNFEKPVVVWSKRAFKVPRDYFFPIRAEEVLISGCVQNPGW